MNVAITIWLYDPSARYLLTHANATEYSDILEWRGPGPIPTEEQLEWLWQEYQDSLLTNPPEPEIQDRVAILEEEIRKLKEDRPAN